MSEIIEEFLWNKDMEIQNFIDKSYKLFKEYGWEWNTSFNRGCIENCIHDLITDCFNDFSECDEEPGIYWASSGRILVFMDFDEGREPDLDLFLELN